MQELAEVDSKSLLMAIIAILFPSVLHYTRTEEGFSDSNMMLSRFYSCLMLISYIFYISYQIKNGWRVQNPDNEVNEILNINA